MNAVDLDYIEREAAKNMDFHLKNMDCLNKEAHTTLSFLFVMISAAFAGAVKLIGFKSGTGWGVSLFILCVYLCWLAVRLTLECLKAEDVMPPANEPKNLKQSFGDYQLEAIRESELENLQARIDFNQARNARIGERLNGIRLRICAAPAVFLFAAVLIAVISHLATYQWF